MAFLDKNINIFHKGFLTTPQGGGEDPTYIGFKFQFDFDPVHRSFDTGMTEDPLFADPGQGLESAVEYLRNIGYHAKADMLVEFRESLRFINGSTPWFFQSLDGLADLWKISKGEEFNSNRSSGRVLTISCLESIDLRITALADLYRKATFDAIHMRHILPENLRLFTLTIYLAEMRSFHRIMKATAPINTAEHNQNANTDRSNPKSDTAQFEEVSNLISLISFKLEHCIFDFDESFPVDGAINMAGDMVQSTQRIKLTVGKVREVNQYTIQDLLLQDDRSQAENSQVKNGKYSSGINTTTRNDSAFLKNIPDVDKSFNGRNPFNALGTRANELQSDLQKKLEGAGANLIGRGLNSLESAVNSATLGNVYSLRNQSLATVIGSFVGANEQAAIQQLGKENVYKGVANQTNPTVPPTTLGNAEK